MFTLKPALHSAFGLFKEAQGESYLLERQVGRAGKPCIYFSLPLYTVEEETALTAVGITVKVAALLAEHDIPCNVVAAYHHDYFFVPEAMAEQAVALLNNAGLTS